MQMIRLCAVLRHVVTSRTLDQIRVNSMMKSPVVLVGVAAGCESAATGHHMAVEDCGNRTIQGLSVFNPIDNAQLARVTLMALAKASR